jgi:hypothetical protein
MLEPWFFALAVPAVLFAGISKGGFGSGASFAATPMLALILDPRAALGLMLPLLFLMDFTALRPWWGKWHWPSARAMMIGAVPGVVLGLALWRVADPDVFRLLIGAVAIFFVVFQVGRARGWIRPPARELGAKAGIVTGVVSGFTSFVSHAGGPAAAVYLLSKPITKAEYQATTVIVFWVINVLKFGPYALLGIFTQESLIANLWLAPVAMAGVWMGVWLHNIVPERLFFGATYVFLLGAGTKLIFDALT